MIESETANDVIKINVFLQALATILALAILFIIPKLINKKSKQKPGNYVSDVEPVDAKSKKLWILPSFWRA